MTTTDRIIPNVALLVVALVGGICMTVAYQLGRIAETGNRMYDTPATCMQTDTLIIHRDRRLPPQPYHVRGAP